MSTHQDGGYRSRKLWFAIATSGLIFAGALLSTRSGAFAAVFDTLVGGLLGSLGLYATGNVAAKHVGKPSGASSE